MTTSTEKLLSSVPSPMPRLRRVVPLDRGPSWRARVIYIQDPKEHSSKTLARVLVQQDNPMTAEGKGFPVCFFQHELFVFPRSRRSCVASVETMDACSGQLAVGEKHVCRHEGADSSGSQR